MVAEWALKRAFKYALKKGLGPIIKGDVDLDQLDVNLSLGKAELRALLLNTEHINTHFLGHTAVRLTAGYIGRATAEVPLTALNSSPCVFDIGDVILRARIITQEEAVTKVADGADVADTPTVASRTASGEADSSSQTLANGNEQKVVSGGFGGWWGQEPASDDAAWGSAVAEGIRLIAGSLEQLLHRLSLRVHNVTVHVDFPEMPAMVHGMLPVAATAGMQGLPGYEQGPAKGPGLLLTLQALELSSQNAVTADGVTHSRPAALLLDTCCKLQGLLVQVLQGSHMAPAPPGRSALNETSNMEQPCSRTAFPLFDDSNPASVCTESSPAWPTEGNDRAGCVDCLAADCDSSKQVMPLICSNEGDGCSGSLHLKLSSDDILANGKLEVVGELEPVQLHLHAAQLPILRWMLDSALPNVTADAAIKPHRLFEANDGPQVAQQPQTEVVGQLNPTTGVVGHPDANSAVIGQSGRLFRDPVLDSSKRSGMTGSAPSHTPAEEVAEVTLTQQVMRGLLLPDVQAFLADALTWGAPSSIANVLEGEWLHQPGVERGASPLHSEGLGQGPVWDTSAEGPAQQERALWASVSMAKPVLEVTCKLVVGELAAVVWYPPLQPTDVAFEQQDNCGSGLTAAAAQGCAHTGDGGSKQQQRATSARKTAGPEAAPTDRLSVARCALEASEFVLHAQSSRQGVRVDVQLQRLEAAEYLPWHGAGQMGGHGQTQLQLFAYLPEQLPPLALPRPTPTFSGVIPLHMIPDAMGSVYHSMQQSLFSSTLSRMSLMAMSASQMISQMAAADGQEEAGLDPSDGLQVSPLLAVCASPAAAAMRVVVDLPSSGAHGAPPKTAVSCTLGPAAVWLTHAAMGRLKTVANAVQLSLQPRNLPVAPDGGEDVPCRKEMQQHSSSQDVDKQAAVAEVISRIIQELSRQDNISAPAKSTAHHDDAHARCKALPVQEYIAELHAAQVCVVIASSIHSQAGITNNALDKMMHTNPASDTTGAPDATGASAEFEVPSVYVLDIVQEAAYALPGARKPQPLLTVTSPADVALSSSVIFGPNGDAAMEAGMQAQLSLGSAHLYACTDIQPNMAQVRTLFALRPLARGPADPWSPAHSCAAHVDVQLRPGLISDAADLDSAWTYAQQHAGRLTGALDASGINCEPILDSVTLQHRAVSGSPMLTQIQFSDAAAYLAPGDLPALWQTADYYLNITAQRRQTLQAFVNTVAVSTVQRMRSESLHASQLMQRSLTPWAASPGYAAALPEAGSKAAQKVAGAWSEASQKASVASEDSMLDAVLPRQEQSAVLVSGHLSVTCSEVGMLAGFQDHTAATGSSVTVRVGDLNVVSISAAGGVAEASVLSVQCTDVTLQQRNASNAATCRGCAAVARGKLVGSCSRKCRDGVCPLCAEVGSNGAARSSRGQNRGQQEQQGHGVYSTASERLGREASLRKGIACDPGCSRGGVRVVLCLPDVQPTQVLGEGEPKLEVVQVTRPLLHAARSQAAQPSHQLNTPQCSDSSNGVATAPHCLLETVCSVHLRGCQVVLGPEDVPPSWLEPLGAPFQGPMGPQVDDVMAAPTPDVVLHLQDTVVMVQGKEANGALLVGDCWYRTEYTASTSEALVTSEATPSATDSSCSHIITLQSLAVFAQRAADAWHSTSFYPGAGQEGPLGPPDVACSGGHEPLQWIDDKPCVRVGHPVSRRLLGADGYRCVLEEEELNVVVSSLQLGESSEGGEWGAVNVPDTTVHLRNHRLCSRLDRDALEALLLLTANLPQPAQSQKLPEVSGISAGPHAANAAGHPNGIAASAEQVAVEYPQQAVAQDHSVQVSSQVNRNGPQLSKSSPAGVVRESQRSLLSPSMLTVALPLARACQPEGLETKYSRRQSSFYSPPESWADVEGACSSVGSSTGMLSCDTWEGAGSWGGPSRPSTGPSTVVRPAASILSDSLLSTPGMYHVLPTEGWDQQGSNPCGDARAVPSARHGDSGVTAAGWGHVAANALINDASCDSERIVGPGLLQQLQQDAFTADAIIAAEPVGIAGRQVVDQLRVCGRWFGEGSPSGSPTGLFTGLMPGTDTALSESCLYPTVHQPSGSCAVCFPSLVEDFVGVGSEEGLPGGPCARHDVQQSWDAQRGNGHGMRRRFPGFGVWSQHGTWDVSSEDEVAGRWYKVESAAQGNPSATQGVPAQEPPSEHVHHPKGTAMPASFVENYLDLRLHEAKDPCPSVLSCSLTRPVIAPLAPPYPRPSFRLVVEDLCVLVALRHAAVNVADRSGRRQHEGGADVVDPLVSELVELQIDRLCLQADVFDSSSLYAKRVALAVPFFEVRDWGPKRGPSGAPPGLPYGLQPLHGCRRLLGMHSSNRITAGSNGNMLNVVIEAVRPSVQSIGPLMPMGSQAGTSSAAAEELEYRVKVASVPLKIEVDQSAILLLQSLAISDLEHEGVVVDEAEAAVCSDSEGFNAEQATQGAPMFFQRFEVSDLRLVIDYNPRRFDLAALRQGHLAELANLVPLGGVDLQLGRVVLRGVQGGPPLAFGILTSWLEDVTSTQVHKFLQGVAPIRSLVRIGGAALQLLSIPAEKFFTCNATIAGAAASLGLRPGRRSERGAPSQATRAGAGPSLSWQLQRAVLTFLRVLATEALGLGATVAAGAQYLLNQSNSRQSSVRGSR